MWLGLLTNGKFVAVKEIEFGAAAEDEAIAEEIKTELDLMHKCVAVLLPCTEYWIGIRSLWVFLVRTLGN